MHLSKMVGVGHVELLVRKAGCLDQMALLANLICLGQAGGDFRIHVIGALESEGMQMISRRERFDAPEAEIFNATSGHDMAVDPGSSDNERGKIPPASKTKHF